MKTRVTFQTAVMAGLAMAVMLTLATVRTLQAGDSTTEVTRPPGNGRPAIDPTTGLPITTPTPPTPWKDPAWPDPDMVLPDVNYDGLPVGEVARQLRAEFKDAFDVLIPEDWQDPRNPDGALTPPAVTVRVHLKNVTASEVFNAMNLMFEAENIPYRWELKMNGKRPTAILRVVPELLPLPPPRPQTSPPPVRQIYFVGDLIGDAKSGGLTMEQLVKTVSEVYQMSYGQSAGVLQYHEGAQLVIVTGTQDQVQFVQQTLAALRDKVRMEHRSKPDHPRERKEAAHFSAGWRRSTLHHSVVSRPCQRQVQADKPLKRLDFIAPRRHPAEAGC